MFVKTRNRLTILYTSVMAVFLLSFVLISYFLLSKQIYDDRIAEATKVINIQLNLHRSEFVGQKEMDDEERSGKVPPGNAFVYYFIDLSGQTVVEYYNPDEVTPDMNLAIKNKISGWRPEAEDVQFVEMSSGNTKKTIALAGVPVTTFTGKIAGTFYTGIDLTAQHQVLESYMMVSIILSIIFIILSSLIGHFLAGKTMVPIMRSFARQREFVADASHELRTPLSVLQSSIEVIESEEDNHFNDFSRQVMTDMKDEVGRMGKLVGDLLTLARADSGSLELNRESFDLRGMADQIERSLQPILARKEQSFTLQAEESVTVFADRERITQLLYILLDNAMKYTPDKGRISLMIQQGVKGITILVKDTGIGMTPQQAKRIFDRFYRVDKGRSRDMGGTGLGLAIADWIVKAHGGTISVDSSPGIGTTFTIHLPIQDKEHKLQ